MASKHEICPGTFTASQTLLFSSFPISTMAPKACDVCGKLVYPERQGTAWVPSTHSIPVSEAATEDGAKGSGN